MAPHPRDTGSPPSRVLAVVGPTAVGKTALAEEIAVRCGGEIVSADSMQVYRGMDIGTAKPSPSERRVPYHCLDIADPGTPFSAALYQSLARDAIDDCVNRGALPVLCGGTGLYVRAALDDLEFPPGEQAGNPVRERFEALVEQEGPRAAYELLGEVDPESAALVHENNTRRVVRALEMNACGESYARQREGFARRNAVYTCDFIGLTMDRSVLYQRIDRRVNSMIDAGLLDEVRRLLAAGLRGALTAAQAIGYKELVPVVDGTDSLDDAVASIKQASRRYAKRQLTWFRADPRIRWLDVTELSPGEAAARTIAALHLNVRL